MLPGAVGSRRQVSPIPDVENVGEHSGGGAGGLPEFVGRPQVPRALGGFAIGGPAFRVFTGVKSAFRVTEIAYGVLERAEGGGGEVGVAGQTVAEQKDLAMARLIERQFLEIRTAPPVVERIAEKPAAQRIVQSAPGEAVQSGLNGGQTVDGGGR